MPTTLTVVVRPHWVNAWFLRLLARPFMLVDGVERPVRWCARTRFDVRPGRLLVGAGIRYPCVRSLLGYRPTPITVPAGRDVEVVARNGPLNSDSFSISTVDPTPRA